MHVAKRITLCTILGMLISVSLLAQSPRKMADKYFLEGKYDLALQSLDQVKNLDKDKILLGKKGICLYHTNDLSESSRFLTSSYENGNNDPELKFYMGRINHSMRKYNDAIFFYKEYLRELKAQDEIRPDVALLIKQCFSALRLSYENNDIGLVENAGDKINSSRDEINPVPSPSFVNRYYYSSNRAQDQYDLYSAEQTDGVWQHADYLNPGLNTEENEIMQDCNLDGSIVMFLRGDRSGSNRLYLNRYAESKHNQRVLLSETKAVTGDSDVYLINDEAMIFASNRSGGYGGYDLYISRFSPAGWSKPENLGEEVNSAYDERYPFINEEENTLFFSSNRDESIGGFDIFSMQKKGDNFSNLITFGYPLNSPEDDIHFRVQEEGYQAYFSSNRKFDNHGGYDIYSVYLRQSMQVHTSEPKQPIGLIRSSIKDEKYSNKPIERIVTNETTVEKIPEQVETENVQELVEPPKETVLTETVSLEEKEGVLATEELEPEAIEGINSTEETIIEELTEKPTEELETIKETTSEIVEPQVEEPKSEAVEEVVKEDVVEEAVVEEIVKVEDKPIEERPVEPAKVELIQEDDMGGEDQVDEMAVQPKVVEEEPKEKAEETMLEVQDNPSNDANEVVKVEEVPKQDILVSPIIYASNEELMVEENIEILDEIIELLERNPSSKICMIGHSLPEGLPEFELMFNIRRVELLGDYLIQKGVATEKICLEAVGSSYPYIKKVVDDDVYAQWKKLNNRVDFKLLNSSNEITMDQPEVEANLKSPSYELFQTVTEDVYFRVLVHTTEKKMYKNAILRYYNDLMIEKALSPDSYRYYVGLYTDFKSIFELKRELETRNIMDAEITAFYNGSKLSMSDAKLLKDDYPELANFIEINQ